jgi:hypothetical protein
MEVAETKHGKGMEKIWKCMKRNEKMYVSLSN